MTVSGIVNLKDPALFIEDLKKGPPCNVQKIFDDAIDSINASNEEIENRNLNAPWYMRWISHIIYLISCKSTRLIEEPIPLSPVEKNIKKIKGLINWIPEIHQTWREDYSEIKQKFDAAKILESRKFEAAKTLQRRWRARLRNKLKAENKTFEVWRATSIVNKNKPVYDRALDMKNAYKQSHYTFTHGQSLANYVTTLTIDQLTRHFMLNIVNSANIYFRIPGTTKYFHNADEIIKTYPIINDHTLREDLISVDASFTSILGGESARYYYECNRNISNVIPEAPLLSLLPDKNIVSRFITRIKTIGDQAKLKHSLGSFYTILIPKKLQDNENTRIAYPCFPLGVPRTDFSNEVLQEIQNDNAYFYSQYRLIASSLTHKEIRAYVYNNLSKQDNDAIKESIRNEVIVFHTYATLYNLKTEITSEQQEEVLKDLNDYRPLIDKMTISDILIKNREFIPETFIERLQEYL